MDIVKFILCLCICVFTYLHYPNYKHFTYHKYLVGNGHSIWIGIDDSVLICFLPRHKLITYRMFENVIYCDSSHDTTIWAIKNDSTFRVFQRYHTTSYNLRIKQFTKDSLILYMTNPENIASFKKIKKKYTEYAHMPDSLYLRLKKFHTQNIEIMKIPKEKIVKCHEVIRL